MKMEMQERYACFGGIEKALECYKDGSQTLTAISRRVKVSKTSVSNNLKSIFGVDAFEEARGARLRSASKNKRIRDINTGRSAELTYDEAMGCLDSGEIAQAGFLGAAKTVVQLAKPVTGSPLRTWFHTNAICKIEGKKGIVIVRYAEPSEASKEYKIHRYRFKITPQMLQKADGLIFCMMVNTCRSYYIFTTKQLEGIQSLNLKFDQFDNSKYSRFLVKVEDVK